MGNMRTSPKIAPSEKKKSLLSRSSSRKKQKSTFKSRLRDHLPRAKSESKSQVLPREHDRLEPSRLKRDGEQTERQRDPLQDQQHWLESPQLVATLSPPVGSDAISSMSPELHNPAGSQRAQEVAMVQQIMRRIQFGHARGRNEARLVLRNGVEVRLSEVNGVLMPTLSGDGNLSRMRILLEEELSKSGIEFSRVELA